MLKLFKQICLIIITDCLKYLFQAISEIIETESAIFFDVISIFF